MKITRHESTQLSITVIPLLVSLLLITSPLNAGSFSSSEWQLGKQEDGIEIYTRSVAGYASTAREVKAVTYASVSPESCIALLTDYDSSSLWRSRIKELKILETIGENHWHMQVITDLPWPLRDRKIKATVQLTHNPENNSYVYQIESSPPNDKPSSTYTSGLDDDELFRGTYKFTPDGKGGSKVIYQILFVSPMRIPNWLMDVMIHQSFVGQLKQFKKLVTQPKYQVASQSIEPTAF